MATPPRRWPLFRCTVGSMYTPHSVSPSAQRLLATAAALHSFPWLWCRRYDATPWQMPRWLKHRKSFSTQQSPVHSHKLLQSIQHTPNSLNLEQHIAQLPIQYDAMQSSQNHFHTETKQLTVLLAPEHHIWMPLIAWRSCSLCGGNWSIHAHTNIYKSVQLNGLLTKVTHLWLRPTLN